MRWTRSRFDSAEHHRLMSSGIARTVLLTGLLAGIGTAGLIGESAITQATVAAVTTAALAGGLYGGLLWLSSRYFPADGCSDPTSSASNSIDRADLLAADGSGDRE